MFYAIMAALLPGFLALCFIGYQLKRMADEAEKANAAIRQLYLNSQVNMDPRHEERIREMLSALELEGK